MQTYVFNPFTGNFDAITDPNSEYVGALLSGVIDSVNLVFTSPSKFLHTVGGVSIKVYMNGQRLLLTDDFTISESGGPLTGYDTITFLIAPRPGDKLFADYMKR